MKLNEFRDDLRKEVRFIEVILDAILLLSNVMFAVVLILPFIFVSFPMFLQFSLNFCFLGVYVYAELQEETRLE